MAMNDEICGACTHFDRRGPGFGRCRQGDTTMLMVTDRQSCSTWASLKRSLKVDQAARNAALEERMRIPPGM